MRDDEELCREALDTLLKQRGIQGLWKEGTEPPDWFLEVEGQTFAVEVTSIHGSTNLDGRDQTWVQVSKELTSFTNNVCSEVEGRVQVPGRFTVRFPAIPNIKTHRSAMVQALVKYFETPALTSNLHEWHTVLRLEGREVAVYKMSETGASLAPQALLTGTAISRLDNKLSEILPVVVLRKAQKMAKIDYPAILVILDEYGFQRSIEEWQARLPPEASRFMAVVRVQWEHGRGQRRNAEIVSGALPVG
jgi:hypothetical protein